MVVICQRCGKETESKSRKRLYCDECKKIVNREQQRERSRRWRERHPEKAREEARKRARAAYWKDPEKHKACTRRWRRENKEKVSQYNKEYYRQHASELLPKIRDRVAKWRKANREQYNWHMRQAQHRRRKAKEGGVVYQSDFFMMCEIFDWKCAYCGSELTPETATIDHIIPLSRGGEHSINNIAPACSRCNSQKGDKTAEEFFYWKAVVGDV